MYKAVGTARKIDIQGAIAEAVREMDPSGKWPKHFSECGISSSGSRQEKEKLWNKRTHFKNSYEAKSLGAYAALVPALCFLE